MDRPYDDIPRQGEHLGESLDQEPTTNVRAQKPARPSEPSGESEAFFQFSYNKAEGLYRIRRRQRESEAAPEDGYKEIDRIPEGETLTDIVEQLTDKPRFVVFENLDSGDVFFDRESDLSEDWTGDGRFDQVTIFEDEDEAAAYAERREEKQSDKAE